MKKSLVPLGQLQSSVYGDRKSRHSALTSNFLFLIGLEDILVLLGMHLRFCLIFRKEVCKLGFRKEEVCKLRSAQSAALLLVSVSEIEYMLRAKISIIIAQCRLKLHLCLCAAHK